MRKRRLRILCACLLTALLLGAFPGGAFAAKQSPKGKLIHVVYDDSRSMYLNNETRWCQAKYAMEVFCAMMSENDAMNIYSMNRDDVVSLRGSDPGRVEKVHAMNSSYGGTPISTLTRAGDALLEADPSWERWLVVLTDGVFGDAYNNAVSGGQVQAVMDGYNAQGLKTVFLAIGDGAFAPVGNPSSDAYAEQARSTKEILAKVTKIANQIFEHLVLGEGFISSSGRKTELNVDIPTNQIVIFAQGEKASVGEMSLNGKELTPSSSFTVRHSGDVMPNNPGDTIKVDTSLHGVVVTYDAGSTPFEQGTFSLVVSNATNVEFYYRPGVAVDCALFMEGQPISDGGRLYAGESEVALRFIDPLTGEPVESELLSAAEFALTVTNNGQTQTLSGVSGRITLEEGVADVRAVASLPGNVYLESERSYTVLPKPLRLALELTPERAEYKAVSLLSPADPILVRVKNGETGQPLRDDELAALRLNAEDFGGVVWLVEKAAEPGVWELRPKSADGRPDSIRSGSFDVTVSASFEIGERAGYGSAVLPVTLLEYAGSPLEIRIEPPKEDYELKTLRDAEPMRVTIRYEDPETGELRPLTESMWQNMTVTASSDSRNEWKLERGGEVGVWLLKPAYYRGDVLLTDSGEVEVTVSASGEDGWQRFSGESAQTVRLNKLSVYDLIGILLPRLIALIAILLFIIGHLTKKRLRLRGLNPRCHFKGTDSPKRKIGKHFLSVILPFVPERATVYCQKSAFQCNFSNLQIVAAGRHSFRIINKSYPLTTTKICGQFVADMPTLHRLTFAFGSFDLTSVDRRTRKNLGNFTFL